MPTVTTNAHELPRLRATRSAVVILTAIVTIAYATALTVAGIKRRRIEAGHDSGAAPGDTQPQPITPAEARPRYARSPRLPERQLTQALLSTCVPGGTRSDAHRI
jgi:hypothetical protein